jgi:cation diffusion facilitator family transporter
MQRQERFGQADRVIKVGFWVNALLMAIKLAAGHYGRSEAVFADGVESACDFIAILFTMFALAIGRKPYDAKHPYGHGKAESLSAIFVSLVIFVTGAGILYQAWRTIATASYESPQLIAVAAAFVTIIVKELLYRFSVKIGTVLQSPAVLAIAKDHRKDALTSIATLIGVTGAFFGVNVMDPLAAGLTALFIFHIGYETFRGAADDLMDRQPPGELLATVTGLAEGVPGVEHVHEIRGRRSGQYVIIDLKLDMDPEMTVKRSHDIATEVKKRIFQKCPNVGDVMIHINPHDEEHEDLIRL